MRVLEGRMSPQAVQQSFPFPATILANSVRLVPLSAQGGPSIDRPRLAEFEVIADPTFILEPSGFDVAATALGGHVIRFAGFGDQSLTGEDAVWPGDRAVILPADHAVDPSFVIGFLDNRAAQISALTWVDRSDTPADERIGEVEVSASIDGPLGPWVSLGRWQVNGPSAAAQFTLAAPTWVRALAFHVVALGTGRLTMPDHIEVREAPGPSVLGAWGDLARSGPYEATIAPQLPPEFPDVSHDPLAATPLALGDEADGRVQRGIVETWYAVDLPEGTRTIRADFAEGLAPRVALTLVGDDDREIPFETDPATPGLLVAAAEPGHWRVRVTQPPASVVVSWDTSASVGGLYPSVARMIRQLAWRLRPDLEEINLLPFRGEASSFLMDGWTGSTGSVFGALNAYPLRDSSSDSENAMLYAAQQLAQRVGDRAVVIVTDAAYSGAYKNEQLWQSLDQAHVQVFALYLPADNDPVRARAEASIMSDWAGAAGGTVSRFASHGDSEIAFGRLAAWLDRPADYAFTLAADTTPPRPGALIVRFDQAPVAGPVAAPPQAGNVPLAMAIILDASGSMLQRLGNSRRIDVAKAALSDLGQTVLPEGLPVELRVFGNDRPGSCENELLLPLGPLDRSAFVAAVGRVESVNLARTSIAATLHQVGDDLAAVTGTRIIVLVTDGDETCGGDPFAEIQRLRDQGVDVRLNIVGFAVDDQQTRALLQSWAAAGAGAYFDAGDQQGLGAAVREATTITYSVFDTTGARVGEGTVGGAPIELPPGTYVVDAGGAGTARDVTIRPGDTRTIVLNQH